MPVPEIGFELAEHLRVEFGADGSRVVGFLETARRVLEGPTDSWPRVGETVAYQCREALESITEAGRPGARSRWRELSREVVKSADRYTNAEQTQDDDAPQLLPELLGRIDEVRRFHDEGESRHQQQLIAVIVARAGVPPSEGSGVIASFQDLFDRLNRALHGDCSESLAREMYGECIALVRQLFMPMESRDNELKSLAAVSPPTRADVQRLLELVATPVHLAQFVRDMATPQWLVQLDAARVFDREHIAVWRAIAAAARRLGPTHAEMVSGFLSGLWKRNDDDPERLRWVAAAARRMGFLGAELLLEMLRKHPDNAAVALEAMQATTELDPSLRLVADFVDLLLNEACSSHLLESRELTNCFVSGIDEHNARDRVELLCFKLKSMPADDHLLLRMRWDPTGWIARLEERELQTRSQVVTECLVSALRRAWLSMPLSEILDLVSMLPDALRVRTRAWLLAEVPDLDEQQLVSEIEEAVRSRWPNGDDIAMLDRAVAAGVSGSSVTRLRDAFGEPPPDAETTRAAEDGDIPSEWRRIAQWALLLPLDVAGPWAVAARVLLPDFAATGPQQLAHRPQGKAFTSTSPYAAETLAALPPLQACELIAAWRPRPGEGYHDPHRLGDALQSVVRGDPAAWLTDPGCVTQLLRHPTYISSYLRAVEEVIADHPTAAVAILDVIRSVHSNSRIPEALSNHAWDYDTDWRDAKRVGLDVIRALASADIDFGGRSDEVWALIDAAAHDLGEGSGFNGETDLLNSAINRPCTRAFETALFVVAAELRAGKPLRSEYSDLLDFALRLEGTDGAEYRAILARRLGWLRHAVPEWFNDNIDLLMGDEAPAGLAQITLDLALQWGRSDRWLLEAFPAMVKDAVIRDVDLAMDHFMVAMLWNCAGYQIDDIVRFMVNHLGEHPELASRAGERLSHIVSDEGTEERHLESAIHFWEAMLNSRAASRLEGFEAMHLLDALDDEVWAQLTRRTLEATADRGFWLHGVADRAMELPPTTAKLAVLNAIVRGHLEPWDRYHIAERINTVIQNAAELESTAEYHQLITALREHDIIRDEPGADS